MSLTYDALELLRADIDAAILSWVASHKWRRADFPVTPEGVVRLQTSLAAVVAQRASAAIPQRNLDRDFDAQITREYRGDLGAISSAKSRAN
jgi:CRISPR/Cas system-associated endonuclease Cas1